jgi:AcrR family transcriptional regulator
MPGPGKQGRYHHGDLRAALIDTAIELIGERGVRGFSLTEASRRLGVAGSAPYAHFADRDELLAAVAVRAHELLYAALVPAIQPAQAHAERLAAMAAAYVRFAAAHKPLFEVIYEAGLDKARYPAMEAAERPVTGAFLGCVRELTGGGEGAVKDLAVAVEATAHGHAALLLEGDFGDTSEAVAEAADRAARATLALVESRHLLRGPAADQAPDTAAPRAPAPN